MFNPEQCELNAKNRGTYGAVTRILQYVIRHVVKLN
jgi:hypothetical protein